MVVEFQSRTGRVYQVYRSTTLAPPWTPVGPLISGDETVKMYIDASGDPSAFFYAEVARSN